MNKITRRQFFSSIFYLCLFLILPKKWTTRWQREREIAQFKRISIPLVRRIYPPLIANKIVSVQPLQGPSSLVYYLRYRYSNAREEQGLGRDVLPPMWNEVRDL